MTQDSKIDVIRRYTLHAGTIPLPYHLLCSLSSQVKQVLDLHHPEKCGYYDRDMLSLQKRVSMIYF